MSTARPDAVSLLLAAAESLRATARTIETLELGSSESRADLRALLAEIRRSAFMAVTLGALELCPHRTPDAADLQTALTHGQKAFGG